METKNYLIGKFEELYEILDNDYTNNMASGYELLYDFEIYLKDLKDELEKT